MSSKRFLIVPEDSSAASRPLPGVTMALATLLSSARFIVASSEQREILAVQTRRVLGQFPMKRKKVGGEARAGLPARERLASGDLRIELALDVTLRHLGGGQHASDLARLACGIEFLQPLFAELDHRLHRRLEIFTRIEFFRIIIQDLSDLSGHRHAVVGVDIDLAHAVLDTALDLGNR